MIESLKIERFRNHRDTTLRFGPQLTAIAGPNGVGKSNALAALLDFSKGLESLDEYPGINPRGDSGVVSCNELNLSLDRFFDDKVRNYRICSQLSRPKEDFMGLSLKAPERSEVDEHGLRDLKSFLHEWKYLKPKTDELSPSYSDSPDPVLTETGRQLASVASQMMMSNRTGFDSLVASFRKIIPFVTDIRATREKITRVRKKTVQIDGRDIVYDEPDEVVGDSLLFDTKTAKGLKANQMSEGTLLTLVILTALHQEQRPRVLLIDDLDAGLHPSAQEDMVEILRKITLDRGYLQIVFSTHSPYILNRLKPEEINVLTADEEGFCRASLLSEHPKAKAAAKVMEPGELWSSVGESWVLDSVLK